MLSRPTQIRSGSVSQDWRNPLAHEKSVAYVSCLGSLETAYTMFSVNLDEAFGLRRSGRVGKAHQVLYVSPALCRRLARPMHGLLSAMLEHAKHFGTTPNLAPLNPENFQSSRSQRVARFNDLFSRVLLTRKSQFLHKINALADLVEELNDSFESLGEELCEQESLHPDRAWDLLDAVHYDLNTCLRETAVLFKSFLHALPDSQLEEFESALHQWSTGSPATCVEPSRHLAHRRMSLLKGQ